MQIVSASIICISFYNLVLIVNSLHAVADARKHLIRYGVDGIGERSHRQFFAEDDNLIALCAVDVRNVNHSYVHADIAHVLSLLAVYETETVTVAEMAVQSVGVADRYRSDARVARELAASAVAHCLVCWHIVYLKNRCLQRCHIVYHRVVARVVAVQSKSRGQSPRLSVSSNL